MYPIIQLKAGREASAGFHHPWVFSGALGSIPAEVLHGGFVWLSDRRGEIIGTGSYSSHGSIAVRLFSFTKIIINQEWIIEVLRSAKKRRELMGYTKDGKTSGFRLVYGEADHLPGVVIDVYGDVVVFQLSTAGAERIREELIVALKEVMKPAVIYEKSDMDIRGEEGLEPVVKLHVGTMPDEVWFSEYGRQYMADIVEGQKTGFFLDQKDLRNEIERLSRGRNVLNLFSYTGASTVAALMGQAASVKNIDSSERALSFIAKHLEKNELDTSLVSHEVADVFQWISHHEETYDMVLVDPPALVKSKREQEGAMKAYHFLNRAAMRLVKDGGIFITSSCSYFVNEDDLAFVLRRASVQAGIELTMIKSVRQAPDHPLSVYFPESLYLKSFIFQVKKV